MSNQILAHEIISSLVERGCQKFAMSPGSRSTPLIFAIENLREKFNLSLDLNYDERSLGFYALGYAKATGIPMPVIVTSGTAVANLMPAVCEAYVSKTPMVILSADRPRHEHGCGANQTMDQVNLFGKFCDVFLDSTSSVVIPENLSQVIHINCRFEKPLEPKLLSSQAAISKMQCSLQPNDQGSIKKINSALKANPASRDLNAIRNDVAIIIIGNLKNPKLAYKNLKSNNFLNNTPIYADITSGLKGFLGEQEIYDYKQVIEVIKSLDKNQIILQISGRFVFYQILESIKQKHIFIGESESNKENLDIYGTQCEKHYGLQCLSHRHSGIFEKKYPESKAQSQIVAEIKMTEELNISEPHIANYLLKNFPDTHALFISNSMAVRNCDKYFAKSSRAENLILIGTNRGLSGIDGIISTALGYFKGLNKRGVLFVGDQTFIHDSNGLEFLKYLKHPVVILLINNSGCKIFSHLPISKHKAIHDKYFYAEHNYNLSGFSLVFKNLGLEHQVVKNKLDFEKALLAGLEASTHRVLEVQFPM